MSEISFKKDQTNSALAVTYTIESEQRRLSFKEVINLLMHSSDFRGQLTQTMRASGFGAYFWEVKPITKSRLDQAFEFAVVQSSSLKEIRMDPEPFQEHFDDDSLILSFPNLRGDAHLVVPNKINPKADYAHLAAFLNTADSLQIDQFWKQVGETYCRLINDQPMWLSTAGLGVSWLHMRIDQRPKYYRYTSYKSL
ncbi:hypothetical protein LVD15_25105 [Fulvivirga maritima]|uniref:DUF6940 family protein n=1 Tax=Fulvivirga maritima TaxID=2904247 RepID=UPI001F2370C9|nr:hypothetical protein [Fulvivirga maritima]UII26536.1 hypothetical protein LVD15_25105 [Fulvivirga maritima]